MLSAAPKPIRSGNAEMRIFSYRAAHFMGKRTVAEYAESPEILAQLKRSVSISRRGMAFERPRPLAEFEQSLVPGASCGTFDRWCQRMTTHCQ